MYVYGQTVKLEIIIKKSSLYWSINLKIEVYIGFLKTKKY